MTITPSGNTLTIASAGAGGSGIWSVNGNNAYYNAGNVGIGTAGPATALEANGIVRSTRIGNAAQYLQLEGGDPGSIRLTAQSIVSAEKNLFIQNLSGEATPGANNNIQFVLGTTASPSIKMTLTKDGNVLLPLGGSGGAIQFGTPAAETGMTIIGANRADVRFDGSTLKLVAVSGTGIPSSANGIAINTSGNVGIGVTSSANKLSVSGNTDFSGNVGIGTTTPVAKLHSETSQANTAAVYGNATGVGGVGVYGQSALGAAVHAEGNATQVRDKGGFVKAMAYIDPFLPPSQYVVRCYNSQQAGNAVSTSPCGMTVTRTGPGEYTIDFGFNVGDRFISLTPRATTGSFPRSAVFGMIVGVTGSQVVVNFFRVGDSTALDDSRFNIIVY